MNKKTLSLVLLTLIAAVLLSCGGNETPQTTDSEKDGTVAPVPHDTLVPPDTEPETETTAPETEQDQPDPDTVDQKQSYCDAKAKEIEAYILANTPVYQREIKSDETEADESEEVETGTPETAETEAAEPLYESYTPGVSYFYMDIESGVTMAYKGDVVRYSASLIKHPFILWALKAVETAEADEDFEEGSTFDVNRIFTYQKTNFRKGSGVIQKSEYGTEYTYLDLLRLTITKSDNVAFYELRKSYGLNGFYDYCRSLGVESPQRSLYNMTAAECAIFLRETYEYFESGSEYAVQLREWMQGTNHRIMLPHALGSPVANKYGWDLGAYHDMGIVFHKHPYILVIMTELEDGTSEDNKFIRNLAKRVESVHNEVVLLK